MNKHSQTIQLDTELGPQRINASFAGDQITSDSVSIESAEIQPERPSGMRVERCRAVLARVTQPNAQFQMRFRATLSSEAIGRPCTGQYLEAIEWDSHGSLLIIGTEDAEVLSQRMPGLGMALDQLVAEYTPRWMEIRLSGTNGTAPSTFHLIIAENPSLESVLDSAWFAVNIPHQSIAKSF